MSVAIIAQNVWFLAVVIIAAHIAAWIHGRLA
jgi:hypothetical protein